MKNIPRIFLGNDIRTGDVRPVTRDVAHYLGRVMRTNRFIAFGGGNEFGAELSPDGKSCVIGASTNRADPSNDLTLYFAPIRRTDDLVNMVTQMGVRRIVPVITERTVAHNINWDRMRKIATEAAEQSNRNTVPEIAAPVRFGELDLTSMAFADERAAHGRPVAFDVRGVRNILVGPEGGFSDAEFAALDAAHAHGISLGATILRAELAAAIAVARMVE